MSDDFSVFDNVSAIHNRNNIVSRSINSFNHFYSWLQNFLSTSKIRGNEFDVEFKNVRIGKPLTVKSTPLYPNECRLKGSNYSSDVRLDCNVRLCDKVLKFKNLLLFKLPIMLLSSRCNLHGKTKPELVRHKECFYQTGGFFLINGKSKVILIQEKIASNIPQTYTKKKALITKIISEDDFKTRNLTIFQKGKYVSEFRINFSPMSSNKSIPLLVLLMYMGVDPKDLFQRIRKIFLKIDPVFGKEAFINFQKNVNKKILDYPLFRCKKIIESTLAYPKDVDKIILEDVLPHVGIMGNDNLKKVIFICSMVIKHVKMKMKIIPLTDRDDLKYKRFRISGELMRDLLVKQFYSFKGKLYRNISAVMKKAKESGGFLQYIKKNLKFQDMIEKSKLTYEIHHSIRSGDWKNKRFGVSQNLPLMNIIYKNTYLRRIVHPVNTINKQVKMRQVHNSQYGRKCPVETPEGDQCGIITHFTLMSTVSRQFENQRMIKLINQMNTKFETVESYVESDRYDNFLVYLNGRLLGFTSNCKRFVLEFKYLRRSNRTPYDVSISIQDNTVQINTDSGRIIKPLYVNKNNDLFINTTKYNELYEEADIEDELDRTPKLIEYIDVQEEDNCLVSKKVADFSNKRCTHAEIDKCALIGLTASLIPFSNHNQSPRNAYACSMMIQAYGIPSTSYEDSYAKSMNVLCYAQKPLVTTMHSRISGIENLPFGQNCNVAIICGGYNIEDAIIFNQGAIDRGMFKSILYRTEEEVENYENEKIERPNKNETLNLKREWEYHNDDSSLPIISSDGLPEIGKHVKYNGLLSGKTFKLKENQDELKTDKTKIDKSKLFSYRGGYYVDKVMVTINAKGKKITKIRLIQLKTPEVGDKFCLTGDHEVLCYDGWKNIKEVTDNDVVMTLNKDTDQFEYQKITRSYNYHHEGKLYKIKNSQLDLVTTLNHKMYVKQRNKTKYELIEAKDIYKKRVKFKKNAVNPNKHVKFGRLEDGQEFNMDLYLEFLGFWIADGWTEIYKRKNSNKIDYRVVISQTKPETVSWFKSHLKKMKLNRWYNEKEKKFYITNKGLTLELKKYSVGAINKFLPKWIWKLGSRQSKILLRGIIRGDSTITKTNSLIYYTSSKQLADDVQRLSVYVGWSANISERKSRGISYIKGRKVKSKHTGYIVHINRKRNEPQINHGHVHEQKIQVEEIYEDSCNVYCIEVPNHIFYVRRNGKCVWTGNSSRHGQKVRKNIYNSFFLGCYWCGLGSRGYALHKGRNYS